MKPAVSSPYTARVGNRNYPVLKQFENHAAFYDKDKDQRVTLSEIEKANSNMPQGMTVDSRDFAVGIRQQLIGQPSPYKDAYPSVKEVDNQLRDLARSHKDTAQVVTIGQSTEGRPIKALRVSDNVRSKASKQKPSVIITGNIHAREWATNGAIMKAAEKLLNGADPESLKNLDVWFIPDANPDGYHHSLEVDPMWRKNTWRDSAGELKGVDLNRNFAHEYRLKGDTSKSSSDDVGASDDPTNDTFRGVSPLSEPEAQAIKNLIDEEQESVGLLDVHGFGRMLLVSEGEYDVSRKEYDNIAGEMNKAIKYVDYNVMSDADLYPTTGGLSNYVDSLGKVGITMELGTSFQPDPAEAQKITSRASDGIVEFIRQMEQRVDSQAS